MKWEIVSCVIGLAAVLVCVNCHAVAEAAHFPSPDGADEIKSFFEEFREACNKKDVEKVKKLLGSNWDYWSCNIDNGIKFESIEVLDVVMDEAMKVSAIVSAVDRHGNRSSPKMVFTLTKRDEAYFIEKIAVPEVEKRNQEFKAGRVVVQKLIAAINAQDMDAVRSAFAFGDVPAFETELTSRGLSWITNAVKNQIQVPRRGSGVSRGNKMAPLLGRVYVPSSSGGTNVLEQFYFKDGKIDRAAPRPETREERLARIKKEGAERCKQFEEQRAEENKRANERALEAIRKGLWQKQRNGAGAK